MEKLFMAPHDYLIRVYPEHRLVERRIYKYLYLYNIVDI